MIPDLLIGYLGTRSSDATAAARILACRMSPFGMMRPVGEALQVEAGLAPCPLGAALVITSAADEIVCHVVSDRWSVSGRGRRVWIDIELTVDVWADSRLGRPAVDVVDLPFLPAGMIVVANRPLGAFFRFECAFAEDVRSPQVRSARDDGVTQ